jgi:acyl dehydratase
MTDLVSPSGEESLDTSDLDAFMGVPMEVQQLREPVAVNDIRRWAQAMHNANPLHYDPDWAAASRFGQIVAPFSFAVATDLAHGCGPANVGRIPNSHLIFGGDEWWFSGDRIVPGDHIRCYPLPYDYKVRETSFAGPTCFQRGDTSYVNQHGVRIAYQRSTSIRYRVDLARRKAAFGEGSEREWTDEERVELVETRGRFLRALRALGHGKRCFTDVEPGEALPTNVLGPHTLASFATEHRAFPKNLWFGALPRVGLRSHAELGYTPEMSGWRGDPELLALDPELSDPSLHGPGRGHLNPRYAKHVGMSRGYGYGASMGAWVLDYVSAWIGEWGRITHSSAQYRTPAFTGDATFLNGRVEGKTPDGRGSGIASLAVDLTQQDGALLARARVEVALPAA